MSREPIWRRYARLFGADPGADTDDELKFHLDMRMRDYMERGMSREEASAAAQARLGDMEAVRRVCVHLGTKAQRQRGRWERLGALRQDLRYGARTLLRAPGFALMAVLTLTVGIGATTAIFSLVHAVLLAPLPYPEPDRLVLIWETSPQGTERNVVSPGNVVDWTDRARSFSHLGAYSGPYGVSLTGSGEPARVIIAEIQPGVARALGVAPVLGRTFVEEDAQGAGDVAILSHALWRDRFGEDPEVLGRRIVLNDRPISIIGVMGPGFDFPRRGVELWQPVRTARMDPNERRSHNFGVLARLAPTASLDAARAEMNAIAGGIEQEHPQFMTGWGVNVVPLHDDLTADVRPLLILLLCGVGAVLLIACGNLASLLLARGVGRDRELAVRRTLGAGRGRIVRQLFTESTLLALVGGACALLVAPLLLQLLLEAAPTGIPLLERAKIDAGMLFFAGGATVGCALLFGLTPAFRLARVDLQTTLRGARTASPAGQTRLREGLLVTQVALSVLLIVGTGLFVRSFQALQQTELGFDESNLVIFSVDLPMPRYPDSPQQSDFYHRMVERARGTPGVVSAAASSHPPGSGNAMTFSFAIEGREATNPSGREDDELLLAVTPGYFETLRQRILQGRAFDSRDHAGAVPVVIIGESLARKHWPEGGAVGERIAFRAGETPWLEIVGVADDVRLESPDVAPRPMIYIPFAQKSWEWLTWGSVVARAQEGADPVAVQNALRTGMLELDPDLPPQSLGTVEHAFRENTASRTFAMTLVAGFAAMALLLSAVGLYGFLSYAVLRQRQEIGVRLALGARRGAVVRTVLGRSLKLALTGAVLGTAGAAAASQIVESMLFGVSALDASTYAFTVVLILTIALGAAFLPAWQASRISPLRALASE
ncbi:MAG: ABC transporter permease [Gemmatimonadota bacterium]